MAFLNTDNKTLYETDFLQWIESTVEQLRDRNYEQVDWENLIDEIESLGRAERQSLKSNLIVVLLHLLKWKYQSRLRSNSWKSSIVEHRGRVQDAIADSPSFRPLLEKILAESYQRAVKQAEAEIGLPQAEFPAECPFSIAEVLSDDFLPE